MKKFLISLLLVLLVSIPSFAQYILRPVFTTTTFNKPLEMVEPEDGTDRLFVVGQRGVIKVVNSLAFEAPGKTFLDISDKVTSSGLEPGLLGLAFHPDYETNGYFYVYYTTPSSPNTSVIARYSVSATNPDSAVKSSEFIILTNTPQASSHFGGKIAFGRDGFLYISLGMGTGQTDPPNNAQNLSLIMGKVLRINVDVPSSPNNYSIPADNPFVDSTGTQRKEIYAWGFRNGWKFNFDSTGTMWLADVGQGKYEEIDTIMKGKNYGWRIMEGNECYNPVNCDTTGLIKPIFQYDRATGTSITGGYVSYSPDLPLLRGKYIYADYTNGRIWALSYAGVPAPVSALLTDSPYQISSFGQDRRKRIYICSIGDNKIYQLADQTTSTGNNNEVPLSYAISNSPNPFNPTTVISYQLAAGGFVSMKVFDMAGREISQLVNQYQNAGAYQVNFQADRLPSGIYYCKIEAGNYKNVIKMALVK